MATDLEAATLDALGVSESAKTAMLSRTHAPIGKGGTNWITKLKPGNRGQLPAYIQNVRNAIMRGGTSESRATAIAIGRVRDWAEGKGNVSAEVRAAAAKAIAEWEKDRAKSKAKRAVKEGVLEMEWPDELDAGALGDLAALEAAADPDKDSDNDTGSGGDTDKDAGGKGMPKVFCVKDRKKVTPTKAGKCPICGANLGPAIAKARKTKGVSEAPKTYTAEQRRKAKTQPGEGDRYPIENTEDLKRAIKAYGRSKTPGKTKAWIISRAKALGATNLLPEGWN